ncbi:MAG: hypothetical protein ABSH22_07545 [Tepidisphaeraceae bacterium]|jgi:hypothetical protein
MSRGFHRRIDLAMLLKPINVAGFRVRLDLSKQLDDLRLEARLAGVGIGNDRLDLDRHHEALGSDEPCSKDSFAR